MNPHEVEGQPMPYGRTLQIVFFGILVSHLIVAGAIVSVAQGSATVPLLPDAPWVLALLLVPAGLYSAATMLGQRATEAARNKPSLAEKLAAYRGGRILQWAMMEGAFIAVIVLYYLSRNVVFLGAAALGFVVFLLQAPSETRIGNNLQLASDERQTLRGTR